MSVIKVVELLGTKSLLTAEKGEELFDAIKEAVEKNNIISLDFEGYDYFSSSFINHSIGQICVDKGWDFETYSQHVTLKNVDEDDLVDIKLAVVNAFHKYTLIKNKIDPQKHYSEFYAY
jgi:hypothetical protein